MVPNHQPEISDDLTENCDVNPCSLHEHVPQMELLNIPNYGCNLQFCIIAELKGKRMFRVTSNYDYSILIIFQHPNYSKHPFTLNFPIILIILYSTFFVLNIPICSTSKEV